MQDCPGVGIVGGDGGHHRLLLGHGDAGVCLAAIFVHHGRFIGIRNRDRKRLGLRQGTVGDLDNDIINIVASRVGRMLEIQLGLEGEVARRAVDLEEVSVGTA